jgi:hypothetical protein
MVYTISSLFSLPSPLRKMNDIFGPLLAGLILTVMVQQVFPDGRFPVRTSLLVIALSALAARLTRLYFAGSTIFTPEFVGAGLAAVILFAIFHRTGWLAQEVPPAENKDDTQK